MKTKNTDDIRLTHRFIESSLPKKMRKHLLFHESIKH